ncbi:MAG: hypothetical protein ACAI34_13275 [Verrucomicrobium sp.]|nr:hypothetical protein [Verrucomicrobium sp.]
MSPEPLLSEPTDPMLPRSNWRMVLIFGTSFIILGIICVIVLYVVMYALKIDPQDILQDMHTVQNQTGEVADYLT